MASFNTYRFVARLAWVLPAFLFALTVHQTLTAFSLHRTLATGQDAVAEVTKVHQSNRMDVTYDYVNLRLKLPDGRLISRDHLSLPHTLIRGVAGKKTVRVKVRPTGQQMVITAVAATQWRIAAINAVISVIAALIFGAGVFAWNRYLRREGDPSQRLAEAAEAERPAGEKVRDD